MATRLAREFLGTGWKFPLQVNAAGGIARARYEQRVEESIYLILSTAKGERVMLRDFGCGIHDRVFEVSDADLTGDFARLVASGLLDFTGATDLSVGLSVPPTPA